MKQMGIISLKNRRIMTDEMWLYKIHNNYTKTKLKNEIILNIPRYNTRFTPFFYWDNSSTNLELNSILRRIQRSHNDHFRNLSLNEPSINKYKKQILKYLPNENWS